MHWFLKCFYGYRNLWDELLFWWVLDYIDTHYSSVDELTVEVEDVVWMQNRRTRNSTSLLSMKIASWFISNVKLIKFVELSKDIRDNFLYDIYFFWWWEVFAESRWFRGWWNYLLRYIRAIQTKPFVLLWGIETPTGTLQKRLYAYLLPKAKSIVCRDQTSYLLAHSYNKKSKFYYDFSLPLVDKYRQLLSHQEQTLTSYDQHDIHTVKNIVGNNYILINIIGSMSTDETYARIEKCINLYPTHTLVYVSCWRDDAKRSDTEYWKWLQWAYPDLIFYDWTEYSIIQILYLFSHASAGIWCRLHFLLLLQEFDRDRYALVYAEKIQKLITSTIDI